MSQRIKKMKIEVGQPLPGMYESVYGASGRIGRVVGYVYGRKYVTLLVDTELS